ncbi:MAG: flagellar hook-basal body complex protein FliE [Cyanobacteria bacterium NC_groundwater_1444_Ag_S-0.65um_54_12]|nr:flagellar hook-basal body complex protein FliE [Cyanobacteria bacterium NC_groundwater_1444_Ag_S-0.65um_54_12]
MLEQAKTSQLDSTNRQEKEQLPVTEIFQPLGDFLGQVNTMALQAGELKEQLASGEDVALHDVMIAAEKASISIQLTTQIRNKLLEAYQEIMRMQV